MGYGTGNHEVHPILGNHVDIYVYSHEKKGACGWVTPRAWSDKVRFFLLFGMLVRLRKGVSWNISHHPILGYKGLWTVLTGILAINKRVEPSNKLDRILKAGSGSDSANCPTSIILQIFDRHLGAGLHVRNQHGILLEDWKLKMYSRSFTFNKISFQNMHLSDSCLNKCLPSNIQTQHAPCAARGIGSTNFWQF